MSTPRGYRLHPGLKWKHHRERFTTRAEALAFIRFLRMLWVPWYRHPVGYWITDDIMVGLKKGKLSGQVRWFVVIDSVEIIKHVEVWRIRKAWKAGKAFLHNHLRKS